MPDFSQSGYRVFSKPFGTNQGVTSFGQIYDSNWVWQNGTQDTTGAWRPLFPSDMQQNVHVDVTGLEVNVGSVAVTGNPQVTDSTVANLLSGISGQLATQSAARWQKVSSTGYVQAFRPISGRCLINKVNGYSKTSAGVNFLQFFDNTGQVGAPIMPLAVQSGANFFYDLAEDGVEFFNGFSVGNSSDPVSIATGSADFIVTVVYKMV